MIKFKNLLEKSGAGDWGTDEARKTLQKDTPKQGITQIGEKNKCRKESVELDEGTLAAKDSNVIDTILDALRIKLIADLEKGDVKNAQEIAKLVKMSIEKDYKHKGYSRLKR